MELRDCPECGARVLPTSEGTCPNCADKPIEAFAAPPNASRTPDMPAQGGPCGIAGWLILPAIGVILSPLLVLVAVIMNIMMLGGPLIGELEQDYPGYRLAILSQTALCVGFFGFQIFAAVAFFMQKPYVPRLMVTYLAVNLGLTVLTVLWTASVFGEMDYSDAREVFKAAVPALIWIPYFLVSKRVKATFVAKPPAP